MKLTVDLTQLWTNVERMGARKREVDLDSIWQDTDIDFDTQLSSSSIEITLDQISSTQGLLSVKGRQVILFISDHGFKIDDALKNSALGNKFHVFDCRTLKDMRARNRFERYHVTNNTSGEFDIFGTSKSGSPIKDKAKLNVCKNCISQLNYQNASKLTAPQRNVIVEKFNPLEFFSTYSSLFSFLPKAKPENAIYGYTEDWEKVSLHFRESADFTCQECKVCLVTARKLLHTHHVNGVKNDNSAKNLMVLCLDCHRKEPFHGHMTIKHKDMSTINMLRKEQGLLLERSWASASKYADPALQGILNLAKNRISVAPLVAHTLQSSGSGQDILFDAAWPEYGIGVHLGKKPESQNWQVFDHNEALLHFSE
ncbi:HNH endonuclease [Cellvibrio polysaccharolyticus]|uniref:HNH endonuclease n=1 Tax=Cellvibrio polysaccharolyticus TaxID=2082724 RepID=A0A928YTT9_9GAMM|nr:HNH endonuclease signature motif containing protein [Cellvibrio polysaccharolyticus]MBE8717207.1 HNH endonuclease [Cellvibrio polysaccharolyticus]